jgi:putative transposase
MSAQNINETIEKDWPHAPLHRLDTNGVFMITAATLHKEHFFRTPEKLTLLENSLLSLAKEYHWRLEAWAVFANHYHLIACSEEGALELDRMVRRLHGDTARALNRLDQTEGRTVWYNFWDTKLTHQRSYLARLN